MGRLNRGPNGPFSGKAGSIIGSSWRDIYYIKGLQKRSQKPRSLLQIEQQKRFGLAVNLLRLVKSVVDMGFSSINPGGATGYNMAISHMLHNAIKGTSPHLEIDYSSVVFCTKGKLSTPATATMELNGLNLKLQWSTDSDIYSSPNDEVEFLIYHSGLNLYLNAPERAIRCHGEAELELNLSYKDDSGTLHIYMYMVDRDRKKWSNSLYVGSAVIA